MKLSANRRRNVRLCWEMKRGDLMSSVGGKKLRWIRRRNRNIISEHTNVHFLWLASRLYQHTAFVWKPQIWNMEWVRALHLDREVLTNTPPPLIPHTHVHTHTHTHTEQHTLPYQNHIRSERPLAPFKFLPDAGHTSKVHWTLCLACIISASIHVFILPEGY